jgi:hypothetical protein
MRYPLRVVPWWTDGASRFLINLLKWYPSLLGRKLTAFEVGSGNSSLFLLSKGITVCSIETDPGYSNHIKSVAESAGYTVRLASCMPEKLAHDLTLITVPRAPEDVFETGGYFRCLDIQNYDLDFDLLINDGVDRAAFMEKFRKYPGSIVVLDNCEFAANWGLLYQGSAKPDLIAIYREFLRTPEWARIIFEQAEGRSGRGSADVTGWESLSRWATAISWGKDHLLAELMVSNQGFPLINSEGLNDLDLKTLEDRCPFDWVTMEWVERNLHPEVDGCFFPPKLDLGLKRDYS